MNREAPPFKSRTGALPWHLGQADTQRLLDYADRENETFSADVNFGRGYARIGNRVVGLVYPGTVDFIRWPSIRLSIVTRMHLEADASRTVGKCYFIGGDTGFIKIGFSVDVDTRLKTIQAHSPIPVRVLAVRDGGEARESAYHEQFRECRQHGEWFERSPELLAEIERLSPSFPRPITEGANGLSRDAGRG